MERTLLNQVDATPTQIYEEHIEKDIQITETDLHVVIKSLKTGKASGEDDITPEMLKAMNVNGVCWLTRVCQEACRTGQGPTRWQNNVVIPKRNYANCRGISLQLLLVKIML